jgi:hypothetical protein
MKSTAAWTYWNAHEGEKGTPIFYSSPILVNQSSQIKIYSSNVETYGVFVFAGKPSETYLKTDETFDPKIFLNPFLLEYTIGVNPVFNFTASFTSMYYFEIFLLSAEEDTFYVYSSSPLSRYNIPEIPGFPVSITVGVLIGSIFITILFYKKKLRKERI